MWTTEMLSSVVNISPGNSIPAKKKSELFTGVKGMPYVATKDVSFDGIINYDNGICIPQDYLNNFRISPKYATLICAEGGSAGRKIAFSHNECCYVNKLFSLQPTNKIIPKFLYYYSISVEFQLQFKAALHGLIGGVSLTKMKKFAISYPSIPEQERIVAKLDVTFTEIDKAVEAVENKITEISSLYENAVTAEFISIENPLEKKLSDVCEKITDGTHQTPKYFDEGYIFLSSKNVTSRKIDWENVRYIDEAQHIQMHKRIAPRIGDVLLAKNGTTGVAAIVDKDIVFDIYVSLAWLRSKGDILPEYLLEFVNSKMAREQFTSRTKGIGVPNLHLQEIREVIIQFPQDKEKQKLLIKKLKNIDDTCNRYKQINKQKHQNLISLKSAILAQELQPSEAA